MSRLDDARLALLALYAEDAYDALGRPSNQVRPDGRLSPDWRVLGSLVGQDTVFPLKSLARLGAERVWYGWLLQRSKDHDEYAVVIRGTSGMLEWLSDGRFLLERAPTGRVEAGFHATYASLALVTEYPEAAVQSALIDDLAAIIDTGRVTVIGHSLGGAMATYLAYELAGRLGSRVSARIFASPKPGDRRYVERVEQHVKDIASYRYAADIVPDLPLRIPFIYPYTNLPCTETLAFDPSVGRDVKEKAQGLVCDHHLLTYVKQLAPEALRELRPARHDRAFMACLALPASSYGTALDVET